MKAEDRNRMYDVLDYVAKEFPDANLQVIAIGLGATTAVQQGDVLNITLEDGSGFVFVRERFIVLREDNAARD